MTINLAAIESNYRDIGDVDFRVWQVEFDRVASPLKPYAAAMYAEARGFTALALAQIWRECQYETDRLVTKASDHNPFNMKIWAQDPTPPEGYAGRLNPTGLPGDPPYLTFLSPVYAVREWYSRIFGDPSYKGGVYGKADDLAEYVETFAPAADFHAITGVDNSTYYVDIVAILNRFARMERDLGIPEGTKPMSQQKIIALSAGHRNTDGGGTTDERGLMDDYVLALKAAFVKAGAKVYILAEHDNDNDPDESLNYGLQRVAMICAELEKKHGFKFDAYISSHYNGTGNAGGSGFHAIFPAGLAGSGDTKTENPLDVAVARAMAKRVKATNTVGLISWVADSPGVMSERETHVGSQGYRLGEMVGTLGIRSHAVRLIIEAGNIHNPREGAYLRDLTWVKNTYAPAIVQGLADVIGPMGGTVTNPIPVPVPDPIGYPKAIHIAAYKALEGRPVEALPIVLSVDGPAGKEHFVRAGITVHNTGKTSRLQGPDVAGPKVGADLKPNEAFFVPFIGFMNGRPYTRTFWGSFIYLDETDLGSPS